MAVSATLEWPGTGDLKSNPQKSHHTIRAMFEK